MRTSYAFYISTAVGSPLSDTFSFNLLLLGEVSTTPWPFWTNVKSPATKSPLLAKYLFPPKIDIGPY